MFSLDVRKSYGENFNACSVPQRVYVPNYKKLEYRIRTLGIGFEAQILKGGIFRKIKIPIFVLTLTRLV